MPGRLMPRRTCERDLAIGKKYAGNAEAYQVYFPAGDRSTTCETIYNHRKPAISKGISVMVISLVIYSTRRQVTLTVLGGFAIDSSSKYSEGREPLAISGGNFLANRCPVSRFFADCRNRGRLRL